MGEGVGVREVRVVDYVRKLEKALIKTLAELGIATGQIEGRTGVWVQPDVASRCPHCPPASKKVPSKIAAIGVKVDARGITRHGFALNVSTDMEYWEGIVGCGLKDAPVINLADLFWEPPEMEQVMRKFTQAFGEVFEYDMVISDE
jgi:lipoyl(octanoyl) transferase